MDILGLRRRRAGPTSAPTGPGVAHDDLPGFLESPPGTRGAPGPAADGWAVLAPPPPRPGAGVPGGRGSRVAVVTAVALALVLLAVAVALALASRSEGRPSGGPDRATAVAAELRFGGVVLERRAVGVTATYPRIDVTTERGTTVAELELPAWNCLTADAPDDPVAAGCTPAATEYARLTSPGLTVDTGADGALRVTGRFPTELRPNGSAPRSTGRTYELEVTAQPAGAVRPGEWMPATGTLRLGDDSAPTTGGTADRLRIG